MTKHLIYALLPVLLTTAACGIKGPPLPPVEEETVQRQKANETKAAPVPATSASADKTKAKPPR